MPSAGNQTLVGLGNCLFPPHPACYQHFEGMMMDSSGTPARHPHALLRAALIAVLLAPSSGCGDSAGPGSTQLSILLKDAPAGVTSAVVTISQIYLQGGNGRVVLSNQETTTDLLTLANDTKTLVQDAVVPSGTYSQLRFVITGAYLEVQDDLDCDPAQTTCTTSIYATEGYPTPKPAAGPLQTPSYDQSGLKVKLAGDALTLSGDKKVLLVDFDVAESFGHEAGGSGQWVMHPVITATDFQVGSAGGGEGV